MQLTNEEKQKILDAVEKEYNAHPQFIANAILDKEFEDAVNDVLIENGVERCDWCGCWSLDTDHNDEGELLCVECTDEWEQEMQDAEEEW